MVQRWECLGKRLSRFKKVQSWRNETEQTQKKPDADEGKNDDEGFVPAIGGASFHRKTAASTATENVQLQRNPLHDDTQ